MSDPSEHEQARDSLVCGFQHPTGLEFLDGIFYVCMTILGRQSMVQKIVFKPEGMKIVIAIDGYEEHFSGTYVNDPNPSGGANYEHMYDPVTFHDWLIENITAFEEGAKNAKLGEE